MSENKEKKIRVFLLPLEAPRSLYDKMMSTPEGQAHPEEVEKVWREIVNMHKKHVQAYIAGKDTFTFKGKTYPVEARMLTKRDAEELEQTRQESQHKIDERNRITPQQDDSNSELVHDNQRNSPVLSNAVRRNVAELPKTTANAAKRLSTK